MTLKRLVLEAARLLCYIVMTPAGIVGRVFDRRDIWLLSEHPDQARDNGFCFFKYLRTEHPEIEADYVIDKRADDYQKISKYGHIIQFNSLRHFYYFFTARIHISSQIPACRPFDAVASRYYRNIFRYKLVFLPHGVSYGITELCLKKYAKINLFICSGRLEYENVLLNYGYNNNEVAYTGFPRLDEWHNITINKKQIVLMPTWRVFIVRNNANFTDTEYYRRYQSLVTNTKLIAFLEKHNLKLIFYLHNNMRRRDYAQYFKSGSPNIEITYRDDQYDIQELLKTSALLITDYSSVHFDFAYMGKPVIYYQFDQKLFDEQQYPHSIYQVERDGFGPVVFDEDAVENAIEEAFDRNFIMEDVYYKRMRYFYELYDNHNCDRVYNKICQL